MIKWYLHTDTNQVKCNTVRDTLNFIKCKNKVEQFIGSDL